MAGDSRTDTRTWFDPRVPSADECVLGPLLDRWAVEQPDKIFAIFPDGSSWTYRETWKEARSAAAGFARLGVQPEELVLSWLPNGPDALRVWFGLNYLGAIYVPLNVAYRGAILEHAVRSAAASTIVLHADLAPRLDAIEKASLERAVIVGGDGAVAGLECFGREAIEADDQNLPPADGVMPWHTQMVIFTSGTTGPSKGVLSSYLQCYTTALESFHYLGRDDRFIVNLPLFHVGGTGATFTAVVLGASIGLVDSFKTTEFWPTIRRLEATSVVLLGAMANFLMKSPPSEDDRGHTLRTAMMLPLSEDTKMFSNRFGCDVYTAFNMTEISSPLRAGPNPAPLGTCGRPRPGVDVRLVDANDCEVAPGEVGELIVRTDRPWGMNHGYLANVEATARAWRNGWFHTGDAFRTDADGNYFFVDRMKDAIRRRGENISSFEVETEVCAHPSVREAAAVAVPSEHGEDEVLVVVALQPHAALDPVELIEFLRPRMPHYMVPRFIRFAEDLPKTPTQKVQKHLLRAKGVTGSDFDREKAGIVMRREKIGG
ncbi:MAG: ATP-dependent acyl-CoA ligase [Rhizobiales bacterium 65-9]|nr:MAG: ATP-dependent acyl-CoA ligase [Rhizobiales bacterium 65-9]